MSVDQTSFVKTQGGGHGGRVTVANLLVKAARKLKLNANSSHASRTLSMEQLTTQAHKLCFLFGLFFHPPHRYCWDSALKPPISRLVCCVTFMKGFTLTISG